MSTLLLLIAVCSVILILCIAGMAITVLVKKNGQFPDTEVGTNKHMKRLGLSCAKHEEVMLWRKLKNDPLDESSGGCGCGGSFQKMEPCMHSKEACAKNLA